MKNLLKKKNTKKDILSAIGEILRVKGRIVTLPRIAKIMGCGHENLRKNYFDFIRENCNGWLFEKNKGLTLKEVETKGLFEKLKNINPDLSDKAWGIGLEDHNTYRR